MASPVPVLTGLTKLKPFIEDPATAVASPQGLGSTDHDLELQLRKRGISKVVLREAILRDDLEWRYWSKPQILVRVGPYH